MKDKRRATVRSAHANRPASYSLMGLSTVASVLAVGLLIVIMTVGGFALWEWRFNREAEIRQDGFNFQQSAIDEVLDLDAELATIDTQLANPTLSNEQAVPLRAQRKAIAATLCKTAVKINNQPAEVSAITAKEC